ncbi:MAG TPA: ABC transporter substrate-binding protein, partial [bacterium]|nr:ABC transporter substrate-binding protein [bacterium]
MKTKVLISIFLLFLTLCVVPLASAQAPKEILVGGTISLSGRFTTMVGPFKKLAENWAALVNERGGIFVKEYNKKLPLRFIIEDDKSDQATSQKFYEKLITVDKVHLLIGPFGSFLSFAASTVAEKEKIPMVMVCANDRKLFERG